MRTADFDDPKQVHYSDFERFFDTTGSAGRSTYFTLYAGQIGLAGAGWGGNIHHVGRVQAGCPAVGDG